MSGGGGGEQTSTQTSKNTSEPPEFIKPYLQGGIQDLSNLYKQGGAPSYYPGQTVAPFSGTTEDALKAMEQRGANGSSLNRAAQGQLTDTINGKYLDPTSNPQFMAALDASHRGATENFMGSVIPGITSAFEGSGRTGSTAHGFTAERAANNFTQSINDSDAKAGADYFNQARGQQIQAAGMAPTLANQDYVDINQLGTAGQARDNQAQSLIDADVAKYNYNQNKDWDYINRYLASLNGGYPGGQSTSMGTTTGQRPAGNAFGSIFGPAMSAAGLGLSAYSAFSDERLKENIEPIGASDNGTNLYLYNYKGDPTPRVGPMAQEVAETNPDAVHMDPSGFLKVNYSKALGLF
jgi:hypothetical protein